MVYKHLLNHLEGIFLRLRCWCFVFQLTIFMNFGIDVLRKVALRMEKHIGRSALDHLWLENRGAEEDRSWRQERMVGLKRRRQKSGIIVDLELREPGFAFGFLCGRFDIILNFWEIVKNFFRNEIGLRLSVVPKLTVQIGRWTLILMHLWIVFHSIFSLLFIPN